MTEDDPLPTVDLRFGDCLAVLRQLDDESVHAVICDPPYGLSDHSVSDVETAARAWLHGDREFIPSRLKGAKYCATNVARRAKGDPHDVDAEGEQLGVQFRITVTDVRLLAMLRAVELDHEIAPVQVEVDDERPARADDDVLMDEGLPSADQRASHDAFRLGVRQGATVCVGACACFGKPSSTLVRVPVRLADYAQAVAGGASEVVALAAAELRAVLALDLARLTGELTIADGADDGHAGLQLLPTQTVRAGTTAGGLSAVLETAGVGQIDSRADGTGAFDLLVHRDLATLWHGPSLSKVGFMGREWDAFVPPPAVWDECLRVLRPGGHLLAFAGSRTADLMGLSVRMVGFEIRDTIMWVYGSGFPKGQNVGKAIDATLLHGGANSRRIKAANEDREVVGEKFAPDGRLIGDRLGERSGHNNGIMGGVVAADVSAGQVTAPATPEAARWEGWNTSLKPAQEPIIVARKPLAGTVAANVLAHGTGGINVDACRVRPASASDEAGYRAKCASVVGLDSNRNGAAYGEWNGERTDSANDSGRWPTNVIMSHADTCRPPGECEDGCPVAELDRQSGITKDGTAVKRNRKGEQNAHGIYGSHVRGPDADQTYGSEGGASRFFPTFRYQAKAPARERPKIDGKGWPTVKPLTLMRWLVRLVTPPGGVVLDPFAGTGSTLQAARDEGFASIGVERDEFAYLLACRRLGLPELVPATDAETGEPGALSEVTAEVEVPGESVVEQLPDPVDPVLTAIATASSYDELLALWREHRWAKDSDYNAAAAARRAQLEGAAA